MKKKTTDNNKCIKTTLLDWIKITLFTGVGMLILLSITMLIVNFVWILIYKTGFITESNFRRVYIFDFTVITILVGCFLTAFVVRYPVVWTNNLVKGIRNIYHGNYGTRLKERKLKPISKVAREFNAMAKQLEITETLSHDFINNFSHECKTPIASINGFAKLLKNDNISEEEKNEYLSIIIDESERLNNLATDILNLSKLENQMILTNTEKFDISEQIRETAAKLYNQTKEKNIEILIEDKCCYVNGNRSMLEIVWQNLLTNAIKFADYGTEIKTEISFDKENVYITVSDKGCVIPQEKQQRLFERFYQGDESHSTKGNGLGLAIVKRITQLHNGNIILKKSDENETVFKVTLKKEPE